MVLLFPERQRLSVPHFTIRKVVPVLCKGHYPDLLSFSQAGSSPLRLEAQFSLTNGLGIGFFENKGRLLHSWSTIYNEVFFFLVFVSELHCSNDIKSGYLE